MIAPARTQCHHRECRMLVPGRRERIAPEYIEVRDIVRLAERIQHAFFRVDAHPRRADFVNCPAQGVAPSGIVYSSSTIRVRRSWSTGKARGTASRHARYDFPSRFPEQLLCSMLEICDQLPVVIAVREMDLQRRNAPVVLHLGIQFDEVFLLREHFGARIPYASLSHVPALDLFLPFRAVAGDGRCVLRILRLSSGGVDNVTADEVLALCPLVDILEIRNRDARGFAVVKTARAAFELRKKSSHAPPA